MKFSTIITQTWTLVEIELEKGEILEPANLKSLIPPQVDFAKGVILSGRAPIWLYSFLCHHYHPAAWIAAFDSHLGVGVVVATHKSGVEVGQVISAALIA